MASSINTTSIFDTRLTNLFVNLSAPVPTTWPSILNIESKVASCGSIKGKGTLGSQVDTCIEEKFKNDYDHLTTIFPEEVWRIVLDLITEPNDFENVSNASLYFRDILLPKRWLLFPAVYKTLGEKYENGDYEDHGELSQATEPPIPGGKKYLALLDRDMGAPSFESVFRIRLVCRTWCQAVDIFYENQNHHYKMKHDVSQEYVETGDSYRDYPALCQHEWYEQGFYQQINSLSNIALFMEHFESTHGDTMERNPIIGRSVAFNSGGVDDDRFPGSSNDPPLRNGRQFCQSITNFLTKYGHHVWYCTLNITDQFSSRVAYYMQLRQWLAMLPNVKVLKIQYFKPKLATRSEKRFKHSPEYLRHRSMEEMRQLQNCVVYHPPPKLRHLEFLSTHNLLSPIFEELIGQNNHLSMLEAHRNCEIIQEYDIQRLINLSQLSMNIVDEPEFNILQNVDVEWPLHKIYLDFQWCPYIPWEDVFTLLENKWGDTLTQVRLNLPKAETREEKFNVAKGSLQRKLNLPRVKQFSLQIDDFSSLDFILPMKNSLEMLSIAVGCNFEDRNGMMLLSSYVVHQQEIQLLGYFYRILKSNIWNIFPNLWCIDFVEIYSPEGTEDEEIDSDADAPQGSYTRREWEQYWGSRNGEVR